jgi:microcystin-dependent protein
MYLKSSTLSRILTATMLASGVMLGAPRADAGTEPYVGEIMFVGFNFCPERWFEAEGQLLKINQHTALFALLGTRYGGDGITTFALPDLRGQIVDPGNGGDPKRRIMACISNEGTFPFR